VSLIGELRRRQVFRAAAWYAAAAWVAIQVASTVIPEFGLPQWSVRAVIVASILGLPVALALAWAYDLSSLGLRREASAPPIADGVADTAAAAPLWRIPSLWIALVLGAGLAVTAQQAWQRVVKPTFGDRPAIAVLPFANLSPDPANAYFADGLHEEILATLARASSLRVISRTSVQAHRDTNRNLREIADALGATLVLEGSVRRAGDDLRLTLQLIDGQTDAHVWAETYDRKFDNALTLQQEVARQIVAEIGATLTPTEERFIARSAPTNPTAYAFYLQAISRWYQVADHAQLRVGEGLLSQALELDPDFALGYALRAKVRVWIGTTTEDPNTEAALQGARQDIERALGLQPELPDALAARASYRTYVERDPTAALRDLERALELAPNDADTRSLAGLTARRLGRFDEAIAHFRESARLMPGQPEYHLRAFETLEGLGRYDEAEMQRQEFVRRFPSSHFGAELAGFRLRYLATGETAGWRSAYERLAPTLDARSRTRHLIALCLASGDLPTLAAYLETADPSAMEPVSEREVALGLTYAAIGNLQQARPHLQSVIDDMQRSSDGPAVSDGAVALVLLGRPTEAVEAADRAVRETPESRDAVNGPTVAVMRAWVLIRAGGDRREEGYAELTRLLGAFRVQPRAFDMTQLGIMLHDDARAAAILREAIEEQDRRQAGGRALRSPAPAGDRPP
jgi:TolB-like protein/Tfp pilus assembly protein PilF